MVMKYISDKERKPLLALSFLYLLLSVFSFTNYVISSYNSYVSEQQIELKAKANGIYFSIYSFESAPLNPIFSFANIFFASLACINFYKSKNFLVSFCCPFVSFCFFILLLIGTRQMINAEGVDSDLSLSLTGLDKIIYKTNYFDLTCYLTVSILLLWQISILLRMLIKTQQMKSVLP